MAINDIQDKMGFMERLRCRQWPGWSTHHGGKARAHCSASRKQATEAGARDSSKGDGLLREGADVRFSFIEAEKARFPIRTMCKLFGVSESGYHAWLKRSPSCREIANQRITVHIHAHFKRSCGTYGSPRLTADLKDDGIRVGRNRVARLMRAAGIQARKPRKFKQTTDSKHDLLRAPNIVERRFDEIASAPNRLWVTDITYIRTWQGWVYLCVFLDVYSRKVAGWSLGDNMNSGLVAEAGRMAITRRSPSEGLIVHSDQGSQYASDLYRGLIQRHGFVRSMSRKGDCWDNAIAESFFATLKGDLIERRTWQTRKQVEHAIREWIEVF